LEEVAVSKWGLKVGFVMGDRQVQCRAQFQSSSDINDLETG
jgi:hypothetical protein